MIFLEPEAVPTIERRGGNHFAPLEAQWDLDGQQVVVLGRKATQEVGPRRPASLFVFLRADIFVWFYSEPNIWKPFGERNLCALLQICSFLYLSQQSAAVRDHHFLELKSPRQFTLGDKVRWH